MTEIAAVGTGRADPLIDPSWTTNMRPASPPPPLYEPEYSAEQPESERDDREGRAN